ncbi:MAG: CHC2 zinc finger domain-containing protein, partial [Candidatus Margulisiibacteriota bacterium]
MIERENIDAIKHGVDLKDYIESRGIPLKKNGKGYFGLCPFHNDTNPSLSVNPKEHLWQCFGCGAAGDVIRFVELFDKVTFQEAVKRLTGNGPNSKAATEPGNDKPATPKPTPPKAALTVKDKKLLARVVGYYQHSFTEDRRGLDYLATERGITNSQTLKDFGTGYVAGTLSKILPNDPAIIEQLKRIGILNDKGNEVFCNCVVFPLYDVQGAISGLYGRNIDDSAAVPHLYLAGPRCGIVNRQAVKRSQTIILTESIIDAATLYDQGFKNVIAAYGVNGLTQDHLSLFAGKVKEVYLAFDADEAGIRATQTTAKQLKEKGLTPYTVKLPAKDINIYFKSHSPEQFEKLLKTANPSSHEQSETLSCRKQDLYEETEHGFMVGFGGRQYEVKGIQKGETQLKVTVKASANVKGSNPFELTTIDLYSSRSRVWFAKLCADLFGADETLVKEDIGKLLESVERYEPQKKQATANEPSKAEKTQAQSMLNSADIFAEILADLETLGVTGEETNKLVGYLAAISRKLDDPLSVLIQSRSAAGKSTLQDAILSLVPDEDYVKYTRITDQALFYKDEDSLVNKILAIEEEVGMGGAAYSIRNIQSSKKITVAATGKDPGTGKMKTEEYTVHGPVAVMITTTAAELEGETASRFLFLTIDESTQMTQAIHQKQRHAETLEGLVRKKKGEHIIKKHHTAQRMLQPLAVINPFTQYLAYPDHSIRTRRDHKKYLGLIRAITFLHQHQRPVKTVAVEGQPVSYIEVTLDDIETGNRLANEVLGQCLDELAPPSRTLLTGIYQMVKDIADKGQCSISDVYFTRRTIREHTGWTDWQVKAHIKQLEDMEYLHVRIGSKGKEYAYALNWQGQGENNRRFYLNL